MAGRRPPRKARTVRSRIRRNVTRRNGDGQDDLPTLDFFSNMAPDEPFSQDPNKTATVEALNKYRATVETRQLKLKGEAEQQRGVRQARRTDEARAEREQRGASQLRAGKPVAEFDIEYDPVRVLDDGVTVKGNVIESVAYVFQLPRIQRDTFPFVGLDRVYVEGVTSSRDQQRLRTAAQTYGGGNGFRATISAITPSPGQSRIDALQTMIEANVFPIEEKRALYESRLREARAKQDDKKTGRKSEDQIVMRVMERMLQEHLNETEGLAGKTPLKLSTIIKYAKRRLSEEVGYDDISLTTPTNRKVSGYVFTNMKNLDWVPAASTKAYKDSAAEKGYDPLAHIDDLLTKEVKKLAFFRDNILDRDLVAFVAVPTSQATRYESSSEKRQSYPSATYEVAANGGIKSKGPLYIAITKRIKNGQFDLNKGAVVGIRYRMAADNRQSLLSLYDKGDPRSRNPYYSFVFGGFRESFDPTRYMGPRNVPLEKPYMEASRDTMKQYAAIRDVVSTTQYFTTTIARLHSFFSNWQSSYLQRGGRDLKYNDSCLMPLQVPANTEDPKLMNLRVYQGRAEGAVRSALLSYVSLFFLLRNILRRANVKATRRSSARDFAVFDPDRTFFGGEMGQLIGMQRNVALLLGRDLAGGQISLELTQLNELPLFAPLQEMLGAAGELSQADEIIQQLQDEYNAETDENRQKELLRMIITAQKGRGAKRQGRKAAREAREMREKTAMQQAAEARGLAEMSPYQYRRYLAEQGATDMIELWQSIITAPPKDVLALSRTYLGWSPSQGGDAWLDQGACYVFLAYMSGSMFKNGTYQPRHSFAYSALYSALTVEAYKQNATRIRLGSHVKSLLNEYVQHMEQRNKDQSGRKKKDRYAITREGEALRKLILTEANRIVGNQYPQFRALLDYFADTEKCIDEAAEVNTAPIFKMGEYPRNVRMLSIMALGIAMKWFTPTVTNYLNKLPDRGGELARDALGGVGQTDKEFLRDSLLKKFELIAEDIQTNERLPNFRKMGQQMRTQYGMETFYTYNPLLFAYLKQKGSAARRLPRELQKQSEAFGVYGNFIVQLRTTANGLLNAGMAVNGISLAQTFNNYADSYRFPGVPKLENKDGITPDDMNPQGAEQLLYEVNAKLKEAAVQTIALGARIGGDTLGVSIPTGIGTYGVGLGPGGPRATYHRTTFVEHIEQNRDVEAKVAFLRAVSIYVRSLAEDLDLDTTYRTPKEGLAEEDSIATLRPIDDEIAKIEDSEKKNISNILKLRKLKAERAAVLYKAGIALPQAEIKALIKIYTGYGREGYVREKTEVGKYGTETGSQERERLSKPPDLTKLPKPVRTALEVALSPNAPITDDVIKDMEMVLSSLAHQYMIIAKSRPIPRVSVGAARDTTIVGPALQASAARYAAYAKGLAAMNKQVSDYIHASKIAAETKAQAEKAESRAARSAQLKRDNAAWKEFLRARRKWSVPRDEMDKLAKGRRLTDQKKDELQTQYLAGLEGFETAMEKAKSVMGQQEFDRRHADAFPQVNDDK
jgi:hypothetical protein